MKTNGMIGAAGILVLAILACTEQTWVKIDAVGGDGVEDVAGDVDALSDADVVSPDADKDHGGGDLDVVQPEADGVNPEEMAAADAEVPELDVQEDASEADLSDLEPGEEEAGAEPDADPEILEEIIQDVLTDTEVSNPLTGRQVGWFSGAVSVPAQGGAVQVIGGFGINGTAVHP